MALLYLMTDVVLLLGLSGWYMVGHRQLRWWSRVGFVLSIVGVTVVRLSALSLGPTGYAIGAAALLAGVIGLTAAAWRRNLVPAWAPAALLLAAVLGPIGLHFPGLSWLFGASGVAFSLGLAGAALSLVGGGGWQPRSAG